MPPIDERDLERRLADQFQHEGVDAGYLRFVVQHLARPDDDWRWCCGSNCDPCVEQLGRLVDAARALLGITPDETASRGGDAR